MASALALVSETEGGREKLTPMKEEAREAFFWASSESAMLAPSPRPMMQRARWICRCESRNERSLARSSSVTDGASPIESHE